MRSLELGLEDSVVLVLGLVNDPMKPARHELGAIGDLVDGGEADAHRPSRVRTSSLVRAGEQSEGMEVAAVAMLFEEGTCVDAEVLPGAVGESAVVLDDERVVSHVESKARRGLGVVGVLDQFETIVVNPVSSRRVRLIRPMWSSSRLRVVVRAVLSSVM